MITVISKINANLLVGIVESCVQVLNETKTSCLECENSNAEQ